MKKVPSCGPERARIMIVGEAPGQQEEKEGLPFVGPAGKVLRQALGSVGIDPDEVFLTNLCKYRPPSNKLRTWFDDKGQPNEIVREGLMELAVEIQRIQPNVIVACGNYPLAMLTGLARWIKVEQKGKEKGKEWNYAGISDWRGSIVESSLVEGFKVIPTFHPSFIAREGFSSLGIFMADLERVKREADFPGIRLPQKELIVNPQGSDRIFIRDKLLSDPNGVITFDIEYIGRNLLCVGMTNSRDWATSFWTKKPSDLRDVQEILLSGIGLNAQNAIFDCSILEWHYGMPVIQHLKYDTMLASHASQIELPKGLDFLCSIYTDQRYYKNMIDWKAVKADKQSIEDVLLYNCIDAWTQHEIMEEQWKHDLNDPEVLRTFEFEMQLIKPLWEMSRLGVRIDKKRLDEYKQQLEEEIALNDNMLWLIAGQPINVKSGKDMNWLLFEKFGLKPTKMNKTGPANDDKTLAEIQLKAPREDQKQLITLIRETRRRRDLISKFLDVQFDMEDDVARMRGHYNPAGTVTGRLASKKFYPTDTGGNQQNIPRDKTVRSMFIPDPPKVFVYADLERAESLVVAYLTQDPEMLRVHGPGMDAHKELASVLYEKPVEEIEEDERYMGKQTRHAGNYMEGPRVFQTNVNKLAAKTGVSIDFATAKRFIGIYRSLHPFLQRWWDDIEDQLWATQTIYNLVGPNGKGRKRIFHGRVGSILPEAVAYNPQSTVGDTLNVALLNMAGIKSHYMDYLACWEQYEEWSLELRDLHGYQALMQVHDAVGFQIYEKDLPRAVELTTKLMTIPLTVPKTLETFAIPVEVAVGPNWGATKKFKLAA